MECFRRQGMIFEAFSELVELLPRWRTQTKVEDPWNSHFLGVCGFLIGHLMRSLGAYERAAEVYSLAETKFLSSPILSSVVERMHCQYVRGLAQATCSLARNVDFRKDFEQSTVRSDFLQGLACYLFAGSQIRQGNYAEAQNTLGRLSQNEEILWLDGLRSEQTPQGGVNITLPPGPTIDTIKEHAGRCGLDFLVETP